MTEPNAVSEAFVRGYHHIPAHGKLQAMSFTELAIELSAATKDSPKYMVIERELKRVLAQDQAKINKSNVILGAFLGGAFGLCGVVIGAHLKDSPASPQVTPASAMQQVQHDNLAVQPSASNIPAVPSIASQPVAVPSPVQHDAQASQSRR